MEISEGFKTNLRIYGIVLIIPIVILLCAFSIRGYISSREIMQHTEQEVIELRNQVEIYNANKRLVQSDLDLYNNLLLKIVPNKEDYFSIIVALEKLSQETGFMIDKYTILLSGTTSEKLALSVEGSGDPAAFLSFLQNYQYVGGRLITNEKMEFSTANVGQTKLSLNFYNKSLTQTEQKIEPINAKDINILRDIQQKVSIDLIESGQEEIIEYETKSDPF